VNILKTFVLSTSLAIFVIFPAVAQSRAPTPEQVKTCTVLPEYELACAILGNDFIAPADVTRVRGLAYSRTHLLSFRKTLPSREVLEWLSSNDYMLVAGPPRALSLLDVRTLNDALFYSKNGKGWYASDDEHFSRNDTVSSVWLALRKSPVPDSTNKTWSEQQALLGSDERIPNVAEAAWGLTTYKEVRGVYLMDNIWVRVSSVHSGGRRVRVSGNFASRGRDVNDWKRK